MVDMFSIRKPNNLLLCIILIIFAMTAVVSPAYAYPNRAGIGINEIALMNRLGNLIKKLHKYEKKGDVDRVIDVMLDLKQEVEIATGSAISIPNAIDNMVNDIKKNGFKLSKNQIQEIKNKIKRKEKSHHKGYVSFDYTDPETIESYEENESITEFLKEYRAENGPPTDLPLRLTIGVSVGLCGFFLCILPIPIAKGWGRELIIIGGGLVVDAIIDSREQH